MSRQVVVNDGVVSVDGKPLTKLRRPALLVLIGDLLADTVALQQQNARLCAVGALISTGHARLGYPRKGDDDQAGTAKD